MGSDPTIYAVIIIVSNALMMLGTYAVWPSRWNVVAHVQLGFFVTAYLIPPLFTSVLSDAPPKMVAEYASVQLLGAVSFVFAMIFGWESGKRIRPGPISRALSRGSDTFRKAVARRSAVAMAAGISGLFLSFAVMGFIPMFAADPLSAKFFRGEYQDSYARVAVLFRSAFYIIVTCIPISAAVWYENRSQRSHLFLVTAGILSLALTMTRGPAVTGILIFVGVVAARKRATTVIYLVLLGVVFPLGSAAYVIGGTIFGVDKLSVKDPTSQVAEIIAGGAPDVADNLQFLGAFERHPEYTWGRTFLGGLIPFHFPWNPSVWTLRVVNEGSDDISETVSGGLRLNVAMWGYVSGGYIGAIIVPLLSGFNTGAFTSVLARQVSVNSVLMSMLAISAYLTISNLIMAYYQISIYALPSIAIVVWLLRRPPEDKFIKIVGATYPLSPRDPELEARTNEPKVRGWRPTL